MWQYNGPAVDPADLSRMAELVPDVTHLLRAEPGEPSISTYKAQVQQPVDGRILNLIIAWLKEHVPAPVIAGIRT